MAFETCAELARGLNLAVAGSELVGLIPLEAVLMAAEHYIEKESLFVLDERQKIRLVVERLGLSSVQPFVPEKRIIEYMIPKAEDEPLASMSVRSFVELVGARTSAPGRRLGLGPDRGDGRGARGDGGLDDLRQAQVRGAGRHHASPHPSPARGDEGPPAR